MSQENHHLYKLYHTSTNSHQPKIQLSGEVNFQRNTDLIHDGLEGVHGDRLGVRRWSNSRGRQSTGF